MKLPEDLKYHTAEADSFQLFTPEEAGVLLALLAAGLIAWDLLQRFFLFVVGA
jgi:hypothetical protein